MVSLIPVVALDLALSRSTAYLGWFYSIFAIASIVWLFSLFLLEYRSTHELSAREAFPIVALLTILSVVLTAVFSRAPHHLSVDQFQYRDFERFFLRGKEPWSQFVFTYPQGAALLFKWLDGSPQLWNFIVIAAQAAMVFLVGWRFGRSSRITVIAASACATSPILLIEAGVNAHLDILVAFAFAAAMSALVTGRSALATAALAIAGTLKGWPIVISPIYVAGLRNVRAIALSAMGFAAVVAASLLPFSHDIGAVLAYWGTLLPIHGGSSLAGVAGAAPFFQNSLYALKSDWPLAPSLAPVALALFGLLAIVYALRPVDRRLQTFALGTAAAFLFVMGLYIETLPFVHSAYAYTWFTPSSVSFLRGLAVALLSGGALFALLRFKTDDLDPNSSFLPYGFALAVLLLLAHGNNFGWYFLPALIILFFLPRSRAKWLLLGAVTALYVSFASSNFLTSPWQNLRQPYHWKTVVTPDAFWNQKRGIAMNTRGALERSVPSPSKDVYVEFSIPERCTRSLKITRGIRTERLRPSFGTIVVYARARTSIGVTSPNEECIPMRAYLVPIDSRSASIVASRNELAVQASQRRNPEGVAVGLYAFSIVDAPVSEYTALRFERRSDRDPSFGGNPMAISVFLSGEDAEGAWQRVPVVLNDRTTASDYPIVDTFFLKNLPVRLKRVHSIEFDFETASATAAARLRISHIAFGTLPPITSSDVAAIGVGMPLIIVLVLLLLKVPATSNEPGTEEHRSIRALVVTVVRVAPRLVRSRIITALAFGRMTLAAGASVDAGFAYIGPGRFTLGEKSYVGCYSVMQGFSDVRIGRNVYVGHYASFGASAGISIGDDCLIGNHVTFIDDDHVFSRTDVPIRLQGSNAREIVIADDVWISTGVTILRGVRIGRGAVIGAGAVVNKDVPDYGIAVGVPAKVIKFRDAAPPPVV